MKALLKKVLRSRYLPHAAVVSALIILCAVGQMTALMLLYIGYLLYWFAKLVKYIVKDTRSRIVRCIYALVLCVGLSPGFAVGMIPLRFISVVHLQNNPEIKQNVPEYKAWNSTLRNASFFNSYVWTAWEGEMLEKDFLAMAKFNNWDIKAFDKPLILDYTAGELIRRHRQKKAGTVTPQAVDVSAGYSYNRRRSNGGGIFVVWDKFRQKVYIISNPR